MTTLLERFVLKKIIRQFPKVFTHSQRNKGLDFFSESVPYKRRKWIQHLLPSKQEMTLILKFDKWISKSF